MLRSLNDWFAMIADGVRTLGAPTWTQRWRRLRFVALLVFVLPPLALLTHLCLALDHLLFPGFKKVKIEKPIFIVGNLRTGSTFLHRLIAGDTEHVASFRTVDLFIQAIVVKKVVALLGQLDEGCRAPVRRTAQWLEERTLTGFRKIHDVRLLQPEEDDFLLFSILRTAALMEIFPAVARYRRLLHVDERMERSEQEQLWRFYRGLVQRHLYHLGGDKQFVSKNPLFTAKIGSLLRAFPDARIINLVRTPHKTVASSASMWHFIWRETGAIGPDDVDPEPCIQLCRTFFNHPVQALVGREAQSITVRYEDLIEATPAVVCGAYQQLGLTMSPQLARNVAAQAKRSFRSEHAYSGAAFGLPPERLSEAFADVMARHGYKAPTPAPAVSAPHTDTMKLPG